MTFDELEKLLSGWYDVDAKKLSISTKLFSEDIHPILLDFYSAVGGLAERDTLYKLKNSYGGPLAGQDSLVPISELKHDGDYTIFGYECQENFRVAASRNFKNEFTYADGDYNPDSRVEGFQNTNIPLQECLITFALKETIASGLYSTSISKKDEAAFLTTAKLGLQYSGRYVWEKEQYDFFLSKNLWCMKLGDSYHFAQKNDWKKQPSRRTKHKVSFIGSVRNLIR